MGREQKEGKIERKLSEINSRVVSKEQNELIVKFKMAAGDVIIIRGWVIKYTREFVRSCVNCNQNVNCQDC